MSQVDFLGSSLRPEPAARDFFSRKKARKRSTKKELADLAEAAGALLLDPKTAGGFEVRTWLWTSIPAGPFYCFGRGAFFFFAKGGPLRFEEHLFLAEH